MSNSQLEALLGRSDDYPPREAWQLAWARREQQEKPRALDTGHAKEGLLKSSALERELQLPPGPAPAEPASAAAHSAASQSEAQHGLGSNSLAATSASTTSVLQSIHDRQHQQRLGAPDIHVLRSSQLDASRLDTELSSMLHEQLLKAFSLFQPGQVSDYEPELTALLRLLIFGFSIWRGHATPGSQLLNLRYRNERCSSTTAGAGGRSAGLQTTRDPAAGGGNSQHSGSSSSGPSGARVAHVGDTVSSTPRLLSSSQSTASPLGGKTGVEGPGLSLHQRLALGAGMVVLPYLWARLGRLAARGWQGGWLGTSGQSAGEAWVTWGDELGHQQSSTEELQHPEQHDQSTSEPSSDSDPSSTQLQQPKPSISLGLSLVTQPAKRLAARLWLALARLHLRAGGVWGAMQKVEGIYRAAALVNLLAFLAGGKYRSLLERLVGARLVYRQATMTRIISFEYLNRQLVWQEVSELLLFLLPLLDGLRARGALARLLPRLPDPRAVLAQGSAAVVAAISSGVARVAGQQEPGVSETGAEGGARATQMPAGVNAEGAGEEGKQGSQEQGGGDAGMERQGSIAGAILSATRPTGPCPVCGTQEPLLPLLAVPCGHCFCYYCLAARTAANRQYACPLDGVRVAAMERWRPGRKVTSALS